MQLNIIRALNYKKKTLQEVLLICLLSIFLNTVYYPLNYGCIVCSLYCCLHRFSTDALKCAYNASFVSSALNASKIPTQRL